MSRFFYENILYLNGLGGVHMNEFEKDPQSKNNDIIDSALAFTFSFGFFVFIYVIGAIISLTN